MIVQVSGNAEPGKATPVTPKPLFKSRYAIVTPGAPGLNVSRRIKDDEERDRLLEIAHEAMAGAAKGHGLILRSASAEVDADVLAEDIEAMRDLAAAVMGDTGHGPERLIDAPDAHLFAWRDWAEPDPDQVIDAQGCFADHGVLEAVDEILSPLARPVRRRFRPCGAHARARRRGREHRGRHVARRRSQGEYRAGTRPAAPACGCAGLGGQIVIDLAPMPKKERRGFETTLGRAFRQDGAEVVLAGWTPLGHFEIQKKRDRQAAVTAVAGKRPLAQHRQQLGRGDARHRQARALAGRRGSRPPSGDRIHRRACRCRTLPR
jgi:ribonuclease G